MPLTETELAAHESTRDSAAMKGIEWAGSGMGLLGATLLATNSAYSGFGFVAFLLSNFCWMAYAYHRKISGLLVMQIGFTTTSLVGIWRWF
jgi:hypothetical protein